MNTQKTFCPYKLRLARNFHGWSLEEVGERVAATRQYIQQLESSVKSPSEGMLSALADAFHVHEDFFFNRDLSVISEEECHFRSRQDKTVTLKNQALSQASLLEKLVEELDENLDLPPVNIPEYTIVDLSDIEQAAQDVRKAWGLGENVPIVNMVRAVENAGIIIGYFEGLSEKIDAFSKYGRKPIIVRNPLKESVCRMRFDIAHECGHLVMHQGKITGDKQTELEANRFASALLLPRAAFLNEFPRANLRFNWSAIYDMKIRWKVSAAALIRRAFDLGVIDAAAYRRASIHMSKTGYSKKEPFDDDYNLIPMEMPELLANSIEAIEQAAPHIIEIIAARMGVKKLLIEKLIGRKLESSIKKFENVVPIRG